MSLTYNHIWHEKSSTWDICVKKDVDKLQVWTQNTEELNLKSTLLNANEIKLYIYLNNDSQLLSWSVKSVNIFLNDFLT